MLSVWAWPEGWSADYARIRSSSEAGITATPRSGEHAIDGCLAPGAPGAADIACFQFVDRGDRLDDARGRGELNHMADAGQNDELRTGNGRRDRLGMNLGRHDLVLVTRQDHRRGLDCRIPRGLARHELLEPRQVLGKGGE